LVVDPNRSVEELDRWEWTDEAPLIAQTPDERIVVLTSVFVWLSVYFWSPAVRISHATGWSTGTIIGPRHVLIASHTLPWGGLNNDQRAQAIADGTWPAYNNGWYFFSTPAPGVPGTPNGGWTNAVLVQPVSGIAINAPSAGAPNLVFPSVMYQAQGMYTASPGPWMYEGGGFNEFVKSGYPAGDITVLLMDEGFEKVTELTGTLEVRDAIRDLGHHTEVIDAFGPSGGPYHDPIWTVTGYDGWTWPNGPVWQALDAGQPNIPLDIVPPPAGAFVGNPTVYAPPSLPPPWFPQMNPSMPGRPPLWRPLVSAHFVRHVQKLAFNDGQVVNNFESSDLLYTYSDNAPGASGAGWVSAPPVLQKAGREDGSVLYTTPCVAAVNSWAFKRYNWKFEVKEWGNVFVAGATLTDAASKALSWP
jgi:hypothetical protein